MDKKALFEGVFHRSKKLGLKFGEFKGILERTDFSDVDKKKLGDIYLWGDESTAFDKDRSLMQALNIDTDDQDLMRKIASEVPTYSQLFSPEMEKRAKGIDLLKAQVEYIKFAVTSFEAKFTSVFTGKEEAKPQASSMLGIRGVTGDIDVPTQLVSRAAQVFSAASASSKEGLDEFVQSAEGKKVISLLEEIGAGSGVQGTEGIINNVLTKTIKALSSANIDNAMRSADSTDLDEITNDNVVLGQDMDYVSGVAPSELELMSSMNPFVRMGMFYQLALGQNESFADRMMSPSTGEGIGYDSLLSKGGINEESLKMLFGRDIKTGAVQDVLSKLDQISVEIINTKWNSPEGESVRSVLFVPVLQAAYIALLNYVVLKGMYSFLTRRGRIVAQETKAREEAKAKQAASAAAKPSMMSDAERAKMIKKVFDSAPLKALLNDNTIYVPGRPGYDPDRVKALKNLIYYAFGGKESKFDRIKNWNTETNPLDGNYDQFFSDLIRDIQTEYLIQPIRAGKGDGKVGPITKRFIKDVIPPAVLELI